MRKVLWAVSTIGTGHVHRSLCVSQELARLVGDLDIIFVSGSSAFEALKAEGVKCLDALVPVKVPVRDGYLDMTSLARDWAAKENANAGFFFQLVNHYQPCLVVADELPSLSAVARSLDVPSALVTDFLFVETTRPFWQNLKFNLLLTLLGPLFLPLARHGYQSIDKIILTDYVEHLPGSWRAWAERYVRAVGPIVRPLQGNVDARAELGLDRGRRLIVVSVGGSAAGAYLANAVIEAYPQIEAAVPQAAMLMVLGPAIPVEMLPPIGHPGIIVRQLVPDLVDYLAAGDLAICCSGHSTLHEIALRAHVPAITCPIANHWEQLSNARRAQEIGFAKMIERQLLTPSRLAQEAVEILVNQSLRERMAAATYSVRESDGARQAARTLASLLDGRERTYAEELVAPHVSL
ncbi:MAG: hypothetical protein M1358_11940 [Chloroflexi bacterium]|nr:hypothetical protein [Chloroflexota bacterium]MCL5960002.1 hypothetical protein [Chloroflexota bacterium]